METYSEGKNDVFAKILAKELTQSIYLLSDITDRSCNVYPKTQSKYMRICIYCSPARYLHE